MRMQSIQWINSSASENFGIVQDAIVQKSIGGELSFANLQGGIMSKKRTKKRIEQQQAFETVLADSFRSHERRMVRYMVENRERYLGFARLITPNLSDPEQVYSRIAFAILSANAPFDFAVKALNYAVEHRGECKQKDMVELAMVPAKADYCNEAWEVIQEDVGYFSKSNEETWSEYRYRLQRTFRGLGIAKASFAACLLYPLEADLACVDTWVQKVFLGHEGFKQLGKAKYEMVEAKIRSYGRKVGVPTFIAQWLIWDHARGSSNNHAIFPGSHKGEL